MFEFVIHLSPDFEIELPIFITQNTTLVVITENFERPLPIVSAPPTVNVSEGIPAVVCFTLTYPYQAVDDQVILNLSTTDISTSKCNG